MDVCIGYGYISTLFSIIFHIRRYFIICTGCDFPCLRNIIYIIIFCIFVVSLITLVVVIIVSFIIGDSTSIILLFVVYCRLIVRVILISFVHNQFSLISIIGIFILGIGNYCIVFIFVFIITMYVTDDYVQVCIIF